MTTLNATLPDYPTTAIEYRLERTFVSSAGTFLRGTLYADTTDASGVAATDLPTPDSGTAEYTLRIGTKRTRGFFFGPATSAGLNDLLDAAGIDTSAASLLEVRVAALEAGGGGGGGGSITDGDKGDIVVSNSGTTWSFDSAVVTTAGRALLDDASAAAQRTTLGLGTAATTDASAYDAAGTASSAVASHAADTTNVHGIADTSALILEGDSRLTDSRTPTAHAASHTNGTDQLADATTSASGLMSASDKTKLNGVADGATANQTDSYLLSRSNHTGTQAISTVSGLQTALDGKINTDALVLSVNDYGATGDGTTDDSAAFASAITAAGNQGLVYVPGGRYRVANVTIPTGVVLAGAGYEATILQLPDGAPSGAHVLMSENFTSLTGTSNTATPYNITIRDMTIDGNKANNASGGHGIALYAYGWYIHNVRIRNCKGRGLHSEWAAAGQPVPGDGMESLMSDFKIHHCDGEGIWLKGPHDTQFINGIVYQNGPALIRAQALFSCLPMDTPTGQRLPTFMFGAARMIMVLRVDRQASN